MSGTHETHTILIVDDEERLRKGLARSLAHENCRTLAAASGEEALGLLKERKVDLVITDLVMPEMDGMALVRNIKSAVPGTKIIVITAYGSAKSMQEAEDLGVGCYLAKPFDLSHLKSRVNELLAGDIFGAKQGACGEPGRSGGHWALCSVCLAGGKTLRAAVDLSRKALLCARPGDVMLAFERVGRSVRDYIAEDLSRNVMVALGKVARAVSGLPSVFTEKEVKGK